MHPTKGQLTKRQRIHMRNLLHERQNGICYFCDAEITNITASTQPKENWQRSVLYELDTCKYVLTCQRCDCEDDQLETVEALLGV